MLILNVKRMTKNVKVFVLANQGLSEDMFQKVAAITSLACTHVFMATCVYILMRTSQSGQRLIQQVFLACCHIIAADVCM